jgi:hypothetical protein
LNGERQPTTEELRIEQERRQQEAVEQGVEAVTGDEAKQHERRAEKSAYLKEKLDERAESERDQDD